MKIVITSTKEKIHSFLKIENLQINSMNLCLQKSIQEQCQNRICLQINSTNVKCLSTDEKLLANQFSIPSNFIDDVQSLVNNEPSSNTANQTSHFRYRPRNTILFFIIAIALIALVSRKIIERI